VTISWSMADLLHPRDLRHRNYADAG